MTVTCTYNNNASRKSVSTDSGEITHYTYDARNRLKTAVTGVSTTAYTYTPAGRTESVAYPNSTKTYYTYFDTGRTESVVHRGAGGASLISSFNYTYDADGNRLQQTAVQGGVTRTTDYTYSASQMN